MSSTFPLLLSNVGFTVSDNAQIHQNFTDRFRLAADHSFFASSLAQDLRLLVDIYRSGVEALGICESLASKRWFGRG